jgi:predicted nucleic acid-binding protein
MILLDTNVLSEVVRPQPAPQVLAWLAAQEPLAVFTTSITQAEVLYGVARLPDGKRKAALAAAVELIFVQEFQGRVLAFDEQTAPWFASISAVHERAGIGLSQMDAMIASIARLHRATLATRNIVDFQHCEIKLINPWDS